MNNEIYILTVESVDTYGFDFTTTRVFTTLEKAQHVFKQEIDGFVESMEDSIESGVVDESYLYYCWYEDGNYCCNHYIVKVEKGVLE